MRAKFIRGQDAKRALDIGIAGEILSVGFYNNHSTPHPEKITDDEIVMLLSDWKNKIDDDHLFVIREGEDGVRGVEPSVLEGKAWKFSGGVYFIPES
jgi:hypothetical protein